MTSFVLLDITGFQFQMTLVSPFSQHLFLLALILGAFGRTFLDRVKLISKSMLELRNTLTNLIQHKLCVSCDPRRTLHKEMSVGVTLTFQSKRCGTHLLELFSQSFVLSLKIIHISRQIFRNRDWLGKEATSLKFRVCILSLSYRDLEFCVTKLMRQVCNSILQNHFSVSVGNSCGVRYEIVCSCWKCHTQTVVVTYGLLCWSLLIVANFASNFFRAYRTRSRAWFWHATLIWRRKS